MASLNDSKCIRRSTCKISLSLGRRRRFPMILYSTMHSGGIYRECPVQITFAIMSSYLLSEGRSISHASRVKSLDLVAQTPSYQEEHAMSAPSYLQKTLLPETMSPHLALLLPPQNFLSHNFLSSFTFSPSSPPSLNGTLRG